MAEAARGLVFSEGFSPVIRSATRPGLIDKVSPEGFWEMWFLPLLCSLQPSHTDSHMGFGITQTHIWANNQVNYHKQLHVTTYTHIHAHKHTQTTNHHPRRALSFDTQYIACNFPTHIIVCLFFITTHLRELFFFSKRACVSVVVLPGSPSDSSLFTQEKSNGTMLSQLL